MRDKRYGETGENLLPVDVRGFSHHHPNEQLHGRIRHFQLTFEGVQYVVDGVVLGTRWHDGLRMLGKGARSLNPLLPTPSPPTHRQTQSFGTRRPLPSCVMHPMQRCYPMAQRLISRRQDKKICRTVVVPLSYRCRVLTSEKILQRRTSKTPKEASCSSRRAHSRLKRRPCKGSKRA